MSPHNFLDKSTWPQAALLEKEKNSSHRGAVYNPGAVVPSDLPATREGPGYQFPDWFYQQQQGGPVLPGPIQGPQAPQQPPAGSRGGSEERVFDIEIDNPPPTPRGGA